MIINQAPNATIEVDNQNYLYFGGTSYLGLANNIDFQKIVIKNIQKWGTAFGSSPNANIQLAAYANGQKFLSKFIQSEAAITVSSGMLAGKIVVETLKNSTDIFYSFDDNHEAIFAENSIPFLLNNNLNPKLLDNKVERISILVDAVSLFKVVPFDLKILKKISSYKIITLVLDESHSIGIVGKNGNGLFSQAKTLKPYRLITVASLGKAMGLTGGVIAGDLEFIESIKQNYIYGSSANMNPAFVASMAMSEDIFKLQFQKLKANLQFVKKHLISNKNIIFDENYPIIYPYLDNINEVFLKEKIIITNFMYPNSTKILNRIIITANHSELDLMKIINILNKYSK